MFAKLIFTNDEYIHPVQEKLANLNIDETREFLILSDDEDNCDVMDCDENCDEKPLTVLAIDIGIRNLAFTLCTMDSEYNFIDIVGIDLVDITNFLHQDDDRENCKLHHSKTFADWLAHVFEYYDIVFESVDYILLEKQPPTGLVGIEQLIFYKYRNKSILISPNSMHKHFRIGHLDYEQRKEETMKIFIKHVKISDIIEEYNSFDRKHDITDAFCLAKFWMDKTRHNYLINKERERVKNIQLTYLGSNMTLEQWFDQFRYRST